MRSARWSVPLWVLLLVVVGCGKGGDNPAAEPAKANPAAAPAKLEHLTLDLGQDVKMEFVLIPAGDFMMGSLSTESGHRRDEGPSHKVTLTKPFYMGVYEVTQRQYEVITGTNSSHSKGENHPVEWVSWRNAVRFCDQVSDKSGRKVRLPTEAEWEHACRVGTTTPWSFGDNGREVGYYAWYKGNASNGHHPVGEKKPNRWGLYDMHGNVWELVYDRISSKYSPDDAVDPTGNPVAITIHVMRGGSYKCGPDALRSARRLAIDWNIKLFDSGFRVVVEKE